MDTDWGALLGRLFSSKDVQEYKAAKLIKKACKKAAKTTGGGEAQLEADLQAFLRR